MSREIDRACARFPLSILLLVTILTAACAATPCRAAAPDAREVAEAPAPVPAPAPAATQPAPAARQPDDARELLQAWRQSLAGLANSACRTEIVDRQDLPWKRGYPRWTVQEEEYWREAAGRFERRTRRWNDLPSGQAPRDPAAARRSVAVFDLDLLFGYEVPLRGGANLTIRDKTAADEARRTGAGAVAEGAFDNPDRAPLPDFLLAGTFRGTLAVRPAPEAVNGAACRVVEAAGEFGRYTLWIDPSHGFHAARVELLQRAGDQSRGRPPFPLPPGGPGEPGIVGHVLRYDVDRFARVGPSWQVAEARLLASWLADDGRRSTFERTVRRTVELDPDFRKLDVFRPRFPDGTPVRAPGGTKIWRDGKVVDVPPDAERVG